MAGFAARAWCAWLPVVLPADDRAVYPRLLRDTMDQLVELADCLNRFDRPAFWLTVVYMLNRIVSRVRMDSGMLRQAREIRRKNQTAVIDWKRRTVDQRCVDTEAARQDGDSDD